MSNGLFKGLGVGVGPNPPTCTNATGTYWDPATRIVQCYQQNIVTGRQYFPTYLTYGNNSWSADFKAPPTGQTYRVVVYGDDGSMAASNTFPC
jgi:hypothetical protein